MTFRMYDVDTGGTEFWTETHTSVPVANGVFSVQLGSVTPFRDAAAQAARLVLEGGGASAALAPADPEGQRELVS